MKRIPDLVACRKLVSSLMARGAQPLPRAREVAGWLTYVPEGEFKSFRGLLQRAQRELHGSAPRTKTLNPTDSRRCFVTFPRDARVRAHHSQSAPASRARGHSTPLRRGRTQVPQQKL